MSIAAGLESADGVLEEGEGETLLQVEELTIGDEPLADTVGALQRLRRPHRLYPHDQIASAFGAIENYGRIALFL